MSINRDNYEAYLLDYFENNLPAGKVAELMVFLQSHPELNVDLEGFEMISLEPDPAVVFQEKNGSKKNVIKPYAFLTEENYEEYFISSAEGELNSEEEKDLEIFIGLNPELKREYELFGLTLLKPDTSVYFPGKQSLKRGAFGTLPFINRQTLYSMVAVAACLALLIGIYIDFRPLSTSHQVAQIREILHQILQFRILISQYPVPLPCRWNRNKFNIKRLLKEQAVKLLLPLLNQRPAESIR